MTTPVVIDTARLRENLYLSLAFSKMWRLQISRSQLTREVSICLDCGFLADMTEISISHMHDTGHSMFLLVRPFAIVCRRTERSFAVPRAFVHTCLQALNTFPGESLPGGFPNLGNSCYSNAALVALSHCRSLVWAMSSSALPVCRLIAAAATLNRSFSLLVPTVLPKFSPFVQEDAAEFLLFLLDALTDDPLVKSLFSGKTTIHRHCLDCGHHDQMSTPFTVLPVSISASGWSGKRRKSPFVARSYGRGEVFVEEGTRSLGSSLVSFVQHGSMKKLSLGLSLEAMCLESSAECEKCKSKNASLFTELSELPELMVLQINRFGKRWFGLGKVHRIVQFPDIDVDFGHLVPESVDCGPSKYELTALMFHTGFMDSGHYECCARKNDRWYVFSDLSVEEISRSDMLKLQAYVLFYTKVVPLDVRRVREDLSREFGSAAITANTVGDMMPIAMFSDPKKWVGSVPRGDHDALFANASRLAGGEVLRDPTVDDIRARFLAQFPASSYSVSITPKAYAAVWRFVDEKGPIPRIRNLAVHDGMCIGSAVTMFLTDAPEEEDVEEEEGDDAKAQGEGDDTEQMNGTPMD